MTPVWVKGRFLVSDWIVLVCSVLASLASGVLAAYGLCMGMFSLFRVHARQVAVTSERRIAATARPVQG